MFRHIAAAVLASILIVTTGGPSSAEGRTKLGYGRLMTNDYFGDNKDRWRTGSWTSSRIWGSGWSGGLPAKFGDLIEVRLSSQIIAPDNINRPAAGDRPYAGVLSLGAHTHFSWKGLDTSLGADLVATGSGTGLGNLQRQVHKLVGARRPSSSLLDDQISGGIHPTLVSEVSRPLPVAANVTLRPFLEGRAGAETLLRAGLDLTIGRIGQEELLVRENVTGQRYRVVQDEGIRGFSFVVGGDIAHVADSIYLPEERGYTLTPNRDRLRAGVHWQGRSASAFYGLTYLGEEFEAQTEGQLTGSIRINFSF
ncbi:lipid A-modifier LpxR family protein [uncultured Sulfitobacter sp.]|uniref:lipid A-modifier LpxR family protein n=1 Tax=uncultured Sulfitobacter sp. TaxID=191468 RepID=UPI00260299B9|nr:lipid A-modifier LpxR family protein [uncultured Sulfitobacter sp.]